MNTLSQIDLPSPKSPILKILKPTWNIYKNQHLFLKNPAVEIFINFKKQMLDNLILTTAVDFAILSLP